VSQKDTIDDVSDDGPGTKPVLAALMLEHDGLKSSLVNWFVVPVAVVYLMMWSFGDFPAKLDCSKSFPLVE
jgi:hypothetical protein